MLHADFGTNTSLCSATHAGCDTDDLLFRVLSYLLCKTQTATTDNTPSSPLNIGNYVPLEYVVSLAIRLGIVSLIA